jgi:hypothetical protein
MRMRPTRLPESCFRRANVQADLVEDRTVNAILCELKPAMSETSR